MLPIKLKHSVVLPAGEFDRMLSDYLAKECPGFKFKSYQIDSPYGSVATWSPPLTMTVELQQNA